MRSAASRPTRPSSRGSTPLTASASRSAAASSRRRPARRRRARSPPRLRPRLRRAHRFAAVARAAREARVPLLARRERLDLVDLERQQVEIAISRASAVPKPAGGAPGRQPARGRAPGVRTSRRERHRRRSPAGRAGRRRASTAGARAGRRMRRGAGRGRADPRPTPHGPGRRRGAALRAHPATDDQLSGLVVQSLAQVDEFLVVEQAGRQLERALDVSLAGAGTHDPRPRPAAEQKVEGRARTVFPAPVSPVIAARPGPSRTSARSIRSRFSMRSSTSTQQV